MKTVIVPKFGFTQEDAQLVRWIKQSGDSVEAGEPIAEVTTDKINMEIEAPASGILSGLRAKEGETVPVTAVIAYVLEPGEALPEEAVEPPVRLQPAQEPKASRSLVTPLAAHVATEAGVDSSLVAGSGPGGRVTRRDVEAHLASPSKVRATPAARRSARDMGIRLEGVAGSGARGRIQAGDVRSAGGPRAEALQTPLAHIEGGQLRMIPLVGMRRTIATRMQRSSQEAPHISLGVDVVVSATEALRSRANEGLVEGQPKVSLTAMIARVVAWALRRHPFLNSRLEGENILLLSDINLGVAVALEEGLIVPVIRQADRKTLRQLAAEINDLSTRARQGILQPDDVSEGTFTISNLGMFGVDRFTAILNPPQSGILSVGRVQKRVVSDEADQPAVRPVITITLSADHRVVDGAVAARFIADVREGLESPGILTL